MKAFFFYTFFTVSFHNISTDAQIQSILKSIEAPSNTSVVSEFSWNDGLTSNLVPQNTDKQVKNLIENVKSDEATESFLQF